MRPLPLISGNPALVAEVERLMPASGSQGFRLAVVSDSQTAREFLTLEMPELVLLDFSRPELKPFDLLDFILSDPWLAPGGIIAFHDNDQEIRQLESIREANFIVIVHERNLEDYLPRIMSIIHRNRRILFQHSLGGGLITNISGSFKLENHIIEARCYANLLCNFLFSGGRIDLEGKSNLCFALFELLVNAIEHGNCGISFEEKNNWLEQGGSMIDLIDRRSKEPGISSRRVTFEYNICQAGSRFLISDEGSGFNWKQFLDRGTDEAQFRLHGRGILLASRFTQNMNYTESGTSVTFGISHTTNAAPLPPALFTNIEPLHVSQGELLFREGDPSTYLYYIVKGRYDVMMNGYLVSTLSPDDMFLGEMSFLLGKNRSASIKAQTDGALIRISKKEFIEAVRRRPHYALLLSRLLAQRLQRSNIRNTVSRT
ncbi:MAG TPA: cyclic nucleotide-binding domain-containing protein [Candidatus Ozemobacteraceae bacterium]|nr:cyclic nucleotide-binding domain-containing protein [Candidatus Ozemobacteraceae bacterium]